jgi:hypothetical protein
MCKPEEEKVGNADSRASWVCRERGAGVMVELGSWAAVHCCSAGCQGCVYYIFGVSLKLLAQDPTIAF